MTYYVLDPSGQRYGPADVATLSQWAAQGRMLPNTMVEDAASGMRMAAAGVPGIAFPMASPTQQQYASYARPAAFGYDGSEELKRAWICAAVAVCCCGLIAIYGLLQAIEAKKLGNRGATAAIVVNAVLVSLIGIGVIVQIVVLVVRP